MEGKLHDIGVGNDLLGYYTKSKKSKKRHLEWYQTLKLLHTKGNNQQSKRQPTEL